MAKLKIQGSSANYAGMKKSGKTTPSPPSRPYPPTKRNAPKPTPTKKSGGKY